MKMNVLLLFIFKELVIKIYEFISLQYMQFKQKCYGIKDRLDRI